MVFKEQISRVRQVRQEFDKIVLEVLKTAENEKFLADLNREQLHNGKKGDGSDILPGYADRTIERKRRDRQPFDRVTLRDRGNLYEQFTVEFGSEEFTLSADTEYTKYLLSRYGDDIFGLNDDSLEKLREKINPQIVEAVRKLLLNE